MTHLQRRSILVGADAELANFILGLDRPDGSGHEASRALLREFDGISGVAVDAGRSRADDFQDWGRKFLTNGGAVYIDMDHLEICTPEVTNAYDFVAAWHGALRLAEAARRLAEAKLPPGQDLVVLANSSDGHGNSFGSHLNFSIPRRTWNAIFYRKAIYLPFLASYLVSSMVFAGQGKVGAEHDRPDADYQISQRADFYEMLSGPQTTIHRPIVNGRDEPHADADQWARLHVICYDSNLCHVACLLKVGVLQIVLAMLQHDDVSADLILDDPVQAAVSYSHDPTLQVRARTASGKRLTTVEHQLALLERADRFVTAGSCDGLVHRADEILAMWKDVVRQLESRDWAALAPRLDWVLKKTFIEQAIDGNPKFDLQSPQIKYLDHLYANTDRSKGLFWTALDEGRVQTVASQERIDRFSLHPPDDTRAWTRAMLLRAAGHSVTEVNWSYVRVRTWNGGFACREWALELNDPHDFTAARMQAHPASPHATEEFLENISGLSGRSLTIDEPPKQDEAPPVGGKRLIKEYGS